MCVPTVEFSGLIYLGLDLTWAHNLLVWWLEFPALGSSRQRLNEVTLLFLSSSLFPPFFPTPFSSPVSPIYSSKLVEGS